MKPKKDAIKVEITKPNVLLVSIIKTADNTPATTEINKISRVSLFTAIVVKDLFISNSYKFVISGKLDLILASLIVIVISYWTRSMALSVVFGLVSVILLSMVM